MPRPRSERRSIWPAVVLVLLPVLYVLSIGPAGRFVIKPGYDASPAWYRAYAPILWATDRLKPLNEGLQGYLRLWGAEDAAGIVSARYEVRKFNNMIRAVPAR